MAGVICIVILGLMCLGKLFYELLKGAQGVPTVPIWISFYDGCRGVGEIPFYNTRLRPIVEQHGIVRMWNAGQWVLLITRPEYLARILRNEKAIAKGGFYRKVPGYLQAKVFGENIIDSHGEVWKRFTSVMRPAIQRQHDTSALYAAAQSLASVFGERQRNADPGRGIIINGPIECWAIDVFGEAFLDVDLGCLRNGSARARRAFQSLVGDFGGPLFLNFPLLERLCQLLSSSRRKSFCWVRELEQALVEPTDQLPRPKTPMGEQGRKAEKLIHHLRQARDSGQMSDFHYRSNLKMMFFAGHENIKSALISCLYELAKDPDIQQKLYKEVSVFGGSGDLKDLPYLTATIYETLRLYPPLSQLINRKALEPLELGDGITVPGGTWVGWTAYGVHTDPNTWGPAAAEFRPERWGKDAHSIQRLVRWHELRGSYIPFNAYARSCIGSNFALLQFRITLSEIVRRFWVTQDPKYSIRISTTAALTPEHCQLIFTERAEDS